MKRRIPVMIGALAVICGANADTIDINGVTWTYTPDEATKTLTLAQLPANTGADTGDIPWSLVITGVTYKVTALPNLQFFNGGRLTGAELTLPAWLASIPGGYNFSDIRTLKNVTVAGATTIGGQGTFKGCTVLETAWFKGAANINMGQPFNGCHAAKAVLFGPDATATGQTGANAFLNAACTDCKVYCPATATWEAFQAKGPGGAGVEVILYGAGRDLDLSVDEAPYFKSGLGLDTRINVTNALAIAAGTITRSQLEHATFNSLMLSVTTQAQLDSILGVVPASVPVAIDPTGATQSLCVSSSDGRQVYVLLPENDTYKLRQDGTIISVR